MAAVSRIFRVSGRQLGFRSQDFLPDMSERAQVARAERQAKDRASLTKKLVTMSKEDIVSFSKKLEDEAHAKRKAGTEAVKYEELPQSLRDQLEGRDPKFPDPHPYGARRAKAMCDGTWVWPIDRAEGAPLNEFKQPMNHPDEWIEKIEKTEWEFWDDVSAVVIPMGFARAVENERTLDAQFKAMLKCKQQNATSRGHLPSSMLEMLYLWQFKYDLKATEAHWDSILKACVLTGEWRLGYLVEDVMREQSYKPDTASLKRLDEIAAYAWDKGYLFTPRTQGKDINDVFQVNTEGGVGAFVPNPDGWSLGFELFEQYEQMKKDGVFKPAYGTPAWERFVAEKNN